MRQPCKKQRALLGVRIELRGREGIDPGLGHAAGDRQRILQERAILCRAAHGNAPADIRMQRFQHFALLNGGGQVLRQIQEERAEAARLGKQFHHVLPQLPRPEEVLRLVAHPEIRRVPLTGEHGLADIGKKKPLKRARHGARDVRSRAVDEHDLAFILKFAEIRSRFS